MNRRKAIKRIAFLGVGSATAFAGYKWYDINKDPDLGYLDENRSLIASLAETIIPSTPDSPGALEAQTHDFIILMVKDCTEPKAQNKFVKGLAEVKHISNRRYGKTFEQCSLEEKHEILRHFEKKAKPAPGILGKVQRRYLGKPFFATLKDYTVEGFCTSEPGATRALAYLPVPGSYKGCIPYQAGQRAWATQ